MIYFISKEQVKNVLEKKGKFSTPSNYIKSSRYIKCYVLFSKPGSTSVKIDEGIYLSIYLLSPDITCAGINGSPELSNIDFIIEDEL